MNVIFSATMKEWTYSHMLKKKKKKVYTFQFLQQHSNVGTWIAFMLFNQVFSTAGSFCGFIWSISIMRADVLLLGPWIWRHWAERHHFQRSLWRGCQTTQCPACLLPSFRRNALAGHGGQEAWAGHSCYWGLYKNGRAANARMFTFCCWSIEDGPMLHICRRWASFLVGILGNGVGKFWDLVSLTIFVFFTVDINPLV